MNYIDMHENQISKLGDNIFEIIQPCEHIGQELEKDEATKERNVKKQIKRYVIEKTHQSSGEERFINHTNRLAYIFVEKKK